MASPELRQRRPASTTDEPPVKKEKPQGDKDAEPRLKHGLPMQILRSLLLATWFNCCCIIIVATQLIGAPLYIINQEYYYAYMAHTKESFGLVITALTQWGCPTFMRVSGDESVRGQLHLSGDGGLKTAFSERLVLTSNHQVYTDWIYLWWFAYTNQMHGYVYIILKESLKYIPVIGQGMMFYGFIFMARRWLSDKPRLQHRLEKLKTRHAGSQSGNPRFDPMWLMIFPEGTNLSENTHRRSEEYGQKQGIPAMKHQLIPRSTGLFFCLQQLKGTVDWLYDCTVAYEGPPEGSLADQYFTLRSTYMQGRPPTSVNLHWRRFAISEIPLDDQKEFDAWLRARWTEKDQLLDEYYQTGRFPSGLAGSIDTDHVSTEQKDAASAGYVETHVRLSRWSELGRIFMVLVGVGLLCRFLSGISGLWSSTA